MLKRQAAKEYPFCKFRVNCTSLVEGLQFLTPRVSTNSYFIGLCLLVFLQLVLEGGGTAPFCLSSPWCSESPLHCLYLHVEYRYNDLTLGF